MRKFVLIIAVLVSLISINDALAQAPTATTNAAPGIGSAGATVNGTVNANGLSTTVFFEYGLTGEYGQTVPADQSPVTGSTATPVTANLILLDPSTEYHYRVGATNASGTTYGADMTFTTTALSGSPPVVITDAATGIGVDFATLNGQVMTFSVSTTVSFQWGTDTNYGNTVTADQSPVTSGTAFPVTATLTSLPNNTTYHYRIVASNINGTRYGPDMTFAIGTGGAAPTATTTAATGIGSVTATLNGTVNANGDSTTVTFEYGLDTGYGSTAPASPSPVSGSTGTAVSFTSGSFLPNTTYHYRVVGTNAFGTTNGNDMTFTTLPQAPTATTNGASSVTTTGATLNGTVNANNDSTTVTFEYGLNTNYGTTVTATQSPVTGSTDTAVSRAITGLTNGITYHYRVAATNAGGTTYGADMTFTAGITAPTATTNAASGVGTTTATLNGTVNANNASTTVTFQYGTSTNYNRTVNANPGTVTGSSSTAVSAAETGLTPNTTYHFRVVAVNAGGTTYGADMTFTTGPGPAVTTGAASAVGSSGATLNGTVNANNASTTVTFEYGLTAAYGTSVPADQSPVAGTTDTAVSTTLTPLTPSTTYHYRVVGQNSSGTTYGADMTFTTGAAHPNAPTATTLAASGVGTTGATLRGSVAAQNQSTTVTFEYGTDTNYGTTVVADQSPVTSEFSVTVTNSLTSLLSNTTYHYRVVAQNAYGTAYGADMTFYTSAPAAPTATTDAAAAVGTDSATLNGTANANNSDTIVRFEYGLTAAYGTTVTADQSPVTGAVNTAVTLTITSLTTNTTYHYRVTAQNAFGTVNGADMTFTTGATAPTATTDAATAVGTNAATLNGTVNANNSSTTVTFEYGLDTNYGKVATADQSPVTGNTDTAVSRGLTLLSPNTTYHYRVVAQNTDNTVYGADMTFTTSGAPPTADTNAASAVSSTGATLNGTVNANNDSTTVTFEYGETTSYGTTVTADQSPVTGGGNTAVSKAITGLANNTTYHYRVVAQNGSGTTNGADVTFFTGTAPPTVTTGGATSIGSTSATLNGTVNANNGSTTVTFEYGETTGYGRTVTADQSPVTGSTDTAVSVTPTDLLPGTTYHFRAVGQNAGGTTNGADMTFTTNIANTPIVTTASVTNITYFSATSGGTVIDEGGAPVTARGVCWSTTPLPTTADNLTADGSGVGAFTSSITGLSELITYFVRAYATNLYGTVYGNEIQFTTNAANLPTVTTANVTNIAVDSATSGGNVIDEGDAPVTARGVCWSTAPNPTIANNRTSDGSGAGAFISDLTGLTLNTTYYVRAYATNLYGTSYGGEITFTTTAIGPTATTDMASAVGTTAATLNGTVNANNSSTAVTFEYGLTTAYGSTVTADQSPVTGSTNTAVSKTISGLTSDAIYHYRVVAQNAEGTTYGADTTFITTIGPPGAVTNGVTGIGRTSATLNGTITANNSSTTVTFEYGLDTSYGATVNATQSPVTGVNVPVTQILAGLAGNTTYHYRVVAQNAHGTAYGEDISFTTTQGPAPPDFDNDGNPDSWEQGPNGNDPFYDGNGDGIPDWQQANVVSFKCRGEDGWHYLTLELPPGQFFTHVGTPACPGTIARGVSLPFGCFTFTIAGLDDGGCTTVTIYLDDDAPQTYYKYGPTPDNPVDHWYEFSFDGQTGVEVLDETTMVLHLCDGQRGDHDLTVNGEILEPGGPAAIEAHTELYFPYIVNEGGASTELGIINMESYDVTGTITYYGAGGNLLEVDTLSLAGQGKAEISSGDLPLEAASAIVSADGDLVGYGRLMTLGGKRYALPGAIRLASFMTIPFSLTNANWKTGIGLFNPNEEEVTATIVDDSGLPTVITLGAKVQQFSWVTGNPNTIKANGNVAAVEIFESLDAAGDMAGILLGTQSLPELYVPTIFFEAGSFTGVGLANPSLFGGIVTVCGHKEEGEEEEVPLGLLPTQSRISANLSSLFGTDTLSVRIAGVTDEVSTPFGSSPLPLQGLASYVAGGIDKIGAVSLNALKFKDGIIGVVNAEVEPSFAIMNPSAADATLSATAYESDGAVIGSEAIALPAGTNMTGSVSSLAGGASLSSGDYLRIVSDVDLCGFEIINTDGRMEILPVLK